MPNAQSERSRSRFPFRRFSSVPALLGAPGLFVLLTACSHEPAPASPHEVAPKQVAPAPVKTAADVAKEDAAVPVSEDRSLDPAVYSASNLPDPNAPWTPQEYATAAEVLGGLARQNRLFLPREDSSRSGAVFARLMARENFAELTPQAANDYLQILPRFFALYAPAEDGAAFPREQVRLAELMLWLYPRALHALAEGHKAGVVPEQPLIQQRAVAVGVVRGAAHMLQETQRYRSSDRSLLESSLSKVEPELRPELSKEQADQVAASIQSH